jgi:hypothetical protein
VLESHSGVPVGPAARVQKYRSLSYLLANLAHYYRAGPVRTFPAVVVAEFDRLPGAN